MSLSFAGLMLILLTLAVAAVYATIRAEPGTHWRLLPGALLPLLVQIAVFHAWVQATAGEGYSALGVLMLALFTCPPTLTANVFLSLRQRPLATPRLVGEGLLVAGLGPLLIWGGLVLLGGVSVGGQ